MNRFTNIAMKRVAFLLSLGIGVALLATPVTTGFRAEAAQSKVVKKKKKVHTTRAQQVERKRKSGTNFRATAPGEPNGAGISDFCSYTLETFGHMGVGCNKYGHDFMDWN